jgi:hypothetical protein
MTVWLLAYPDIVPDIGHLRHRYIMVSMAVRFDYIQAGKRPIMARFQMLYIIRSLCHSCR